jgi:hypothetical protein
MSVLDSFPPPVLDSTKWSDYQIGSTALQVGFPENGCFVHGVDDHGDHVYVKSKNKITIPANRFFAAKIFYTDLYSDDEHNIRYYFGFRSDQEDGGGNSLFGVDVMMLVEPGPVYTFQQKVITAGIENISSLLIDPTSGANGGFKVIRNGLVYSLYYYNGGWVHLVDVNLGFNGVGYIQFGVQADNPSLSYFPWVAQT